MGSPLAELAHGRAGAAIVGVAAGLLWLTACSASPPGDHPPSASPSATPTTTTPQVLRGQVWIAFQAMTWDRSDGIFLARPDGQGAHQLVPELSGDEWHPDWSPDGQQLAFIHHTPADRTELWVVDADGQNARMLQRCDLPCNELGYPDWSPDGSAIYYGVSADVPVQGDTPTTFAVDRYELASGKVNRVLARHGDTAEQPRISPDGNHVAYTRVRDSADHATEAAIFLADLRGGPERRLTDWSMVAMHPDWTPDGRIVFDTYDIMVFKDTYDPTGSKEPSGPGNLWIMNPDGSHRTALTAFGTGGEHASQPRVAPDGSGVSFTDDRGSNRLMAFIRLDGTGQRWVTGHPMTGTHAEIRPTL